MITNVLNSSGDLVKVKASKWKNLLVYKCYWDLYAHDTDFFQSSEIVLMIMKYFFSENYVFTQFFQWIFKLGKRNIRSVNTPIC